MNEGKRAPRRAARTEEVIEVPVTDVTEEQSNDVQEQDEPTRESVREVTVLAQAPRDGMLASAELAAAPDVFPEFAVSLQEANRRVKLLQEFVRGHMVEGEDYGVIPGASPKPTLFKPGAEKLNAIFGLAPVVEVTGRVEDWDAGFLAYEVKVTLLNKRSGQIEAEGVGHCNSRERKYKSQDAANVANTVLKMAKKRALIDATLSATRASGIFTQDLEDLDVRGGGNFNSAPSGNRGGYGEQRSAPRGDFGNRPAGREGGYGGDAQGGSGNTLTEAQRGAILAMANKAFGRNVNEEMARLIDKPIAQLSKSEASGIIDHLRGLLPEREGAGNGNRDFKRSDFNNR